MDVPYPRRAGLDVRKGSVVAAVRLAAANAVLGEVGAFDTTTAGLLALSGWLAEQGCTPVAMEATGVRCKPVWHILSDGDVTLILANAAHVKNVPGRKTDVADAVWLSDLLAHGLIRASFVPEPATQAMRSPLRTREQPARQQASHVQRLRKTLEDANIKLSSVLASMAGLSGRDIIKAIIAGESDPDKLLTLVRRGVKTPREKIRAALPGRITGQRRFLLRLHLRQIDGLDAAIEGIDAQVGRDLEPFRQAARLLRTHLGISDLGGQVVIPEIGIDMSRFPTAGHLVSWAGLCPRNDESAGKRRSNRLRKGGASWLKAMLAQCAWARLAKGSVQQSWMGGQGEGAVRKKGSCYQPQFQRLRHRRGPKKAICAVAASMLTAIYHRLRNGTVYRDLGANHFHRSPKVQARRLAKANRKARLHLHDQAKASGSSFCLGNTPEREDAAWTLIKWLTSSEVAGGWSRFTGHFAPWSATLRRAGDESFHR